MAKKQLHMNDTYQKNFAQLFNSVSLRHSRWEVWADFVVMSAIDISNIVDSSHAEERTEAYKRLAGKYEEQELTCFAQMLAETIMSMDEHPDQDFLGDLFMRLDLGNDRTGQFFTPYSVSRLMAELNACDENLEKRVQKRGWFGVCDPTCGAGGLLVAFANACQKRHINYQADVLFVGQDIDYIAGCMCYLQLSLMGCPGYVVIANTLSNPALCLDERGLIPAPAPNIWYTPFYFRAEWHYRRIFANLEYLVDASIAHYQKTAPEEKPITLSVREGTTDGQLTLF